jgi:hypothetical protein
MESKMEFDEEMSSLQIEDLGEYFLQTDLGDSWKGFSLGYTDEDGAPAAAGTPAAAGRLSSKPVDIPTGRTSTSSTASSSSGAAQLTSPPLASITEMLKQGGLPNYGSPRKDFAALFQSIAAAGGPAAAVAAHAAAMSKMGHGDVSMGDEAMELNSFSLDTLRKASLLAAQTGKGMLPFGCVGCCCVSVPC